MIHTFSIECRPAIFIYGFICILLSQTTSFSQTSFELGRSATTLAPRPSGNTISVITVKQDTVMIESSGKLNTTTDGAASWNILSSKEGINPGGVAAIAYHHSTLFLSTVGSGPDGTQGAGKGISVSKDFGVTWTGYSQPLDTATLRGPVTRTDASGHDITLSLVRDVTVRHTPFLTDSIYGVAIKTAAENITYDIAATDSSLWIASFAGGLRKSVIQSNGTLGYFTMAPLPPDSLTEIRPDVDYNFVMDPIQHLNHRVFSVLAASDGIWAGTAGGLNHSTDGGISWKRYTDADGLYGNFVVALGEQTYIESFVTHRNIWAATNVIFPEGGLSYSDDDGTTWHIVLRGPFVNNVSFDGKTVYAATAQGMYRSKDLGQTWEQFVTLTDMSNGDRTHSTEFTSVGISSGQNGKKLFFGSVDGLGISEDDGISWKISRAFVDPGKNGEPKSYVYPNPFSPKYGAARFKFDMAGLALSDKVTIRVYDFAMALVATVAKDQPAANVITWSGINNHGRRVANGTYIYIIEAGEKKFWGKVTVRN